MDADRSIPRRRFVSLAGPLCLAAFAGCTDDEEENETEEADENESGGAAENGTTAGDENESAVVDEEEELPEIEGTNLFVEVVDEEGESPVPGATVTVAGGAYDEEEFETDASGTVILQDVEPGDYRLVAMTEAGEDEADVSVAEGEDANVSLEVPVVMEDDADEDGADGNANETDADDA
jgi:hypothetical protein